MNNTTSKTPFWIYAIPFLIFISQIVLNFSFSNPDLVFTVMKNDDMTRLAQIRDWMGGQGWFDLMQYRLGLGDGTLMHWSRWVDVPIAGLIWVFGLVLEPALAEQAALVVWPALMAGAAIYLVARIALSIGGIAAAFAGLIFGAMTILQSGKFDPGAIDHHNVQIVLILALCAALCAPDTKTRNGFLAGIAAATALVVALEALILIVMICCFFTIIWAVNGPIAKSQSIAFAFGFTLIFVLGYLTAGYDPTKTVYRCDAFDAQLFYLGLLGCGVLALLALFVSQMSIAMRFSLLLSLSVVAILIATQTSPDCLSNPLKQIMPYVHDNWLAKVKEAQPIITAIAVDRHYFFIGRIVVPFITVLYLISLYRSKNHTQAVLLFAAIISGATALAFYQIRFTVFSQILVLPALAWVAAIYFEKFRATRHIPSLTGLLFVLFLLFDDVWLGVSGILKTFDSRKEENITENAILADCFDANSVEQLNSVPAGSILAHVNAAPELLLFTHHRAVGSNFHRAQTGIELATRLFIEPTADTLPRIVNAGIDYVLVCNSQETEFPNSLASQLSNQRPVAGLTPVLDIDNSMVLYKVVN